MPRLLLIISIFAIFSARKVSSEEPNYIGCFKMSSLKAYKGVDSRETPHFCKLLCSNNFLPIAGTGNGRDCFCGSEEQLQMSEKVPESTCNLPCRGDRSQICGGYHKLSVYRTSVPIIASYKGCFTDPKHTFLKLPKGPSALMTPDYCKKLCAANYLPISGTMIGQYCYCGMEEDFEAMLKFDQRPEWECPKVCRGDTRLTCGGNGRLSVYATFDAPQPDSIKVYAGCYAAAPGQMVLSVNKGRNAKQTPQYCIAICRAHGYEVAGVWFLSGCSCGSVGEVNQLMRRPEVECNSKCSGDQFQICGGNRDHTFGYRFSVYWTKEEPDD